MSAVHLLALLLACSVALNIAITAALLAHHTGAPTGQAILTGAGAAATTLSLYLAAITTYR